MAATVTLTRRRIGPTQSPVVSATISKRNSEVKADNAFKKAGLTGTIAFLLFLDWSWDAYDHVLDILKNCNYSHKCSVYNQDHLQSSCGNEGNKTPPSMSTEQAMMTKALVA